MTQHGENSAAHIALGVDRRTSLRDAVAQSTLAASLLDAKTHEVIVTSPGAAKLLRSTQAKLVGAGTSDFMLDDRSVDEALAALASGAIESYQALRTVKSCRRLRVPRAVVGAHRRGRGQHASSRSCSPTSRRCQSGRESLGFVGPPPELPAVPGLDRLSGRETEVLERLISGARVPQIAEQMFLAPATVRNHLFRRCTANSVSTRRASSSRLLRPSLRTPLPTAGEPASRRHAVACSACRRPSSPCFRARSSSRRPRLSCSAAVAGWRDAAAPAPSASLDRKGDQGGQEGQAEGEREPDDGHHALGRGVGRRPSDKRTLALSHTIGGAISPKSVVASRTGLVFAQNMMYRHTITVYSSDGALVKTIPTV